MIYYDKISRESISSIQLRKRLEAHLESTIRVGMSYEEFLKLKSKGRQEMRDEIRGWIDERNLDIEQWEDFFGEFNAKFGEKE